MTPYFIFIFLQAFTVLAADARMQATGVSNFWNKHGLQMNEAVVRFNLVHTGCRATFRGLQSIPEKKSKSTDKRVESWQFCHFRAKDFVFLSWCNLHKTVPTFKKQQEKKHGWERRGRQRKIQLP